MTPEDGVREETEVLTSWSAERAAVTAYRDRQAMGAAAASMIARQILHVLEVKPEVNGIRCRAKPVRNDLQSIGHQGYSLGPYHSLSYG